MNPKKNRAVVMRVVAYATIIILSVITTALLLFVALGYRFNRDGEVVKSGLLLVDNKPEAAQIYIDGKLEDGSSPGRFVLPTRSYELSLERTGYIGWKRQLTILPQTVLQVRYPILIPEKLTTEALVDIQKPQTITQADNNKQLVYHVANESNLRRIVLDPVQPEISIVTLPNTVTREGGSLGTVTFIDWSLNGKHVLAQQTLPSGAVHMLSIDVDNPDRTVDMTAAFAAAPPSDITYVDNETRIIYGLHEGTLRRYNIEDSTTELVAERILSFRSYGDDLLALTRLSEDGTQVEVTVQRGETEAVLETFADTAARPEIAYAEYDSDAYLVVASSDQKLARVYKDPLSKPILKRQIPFVLLPIESVETIKFSPNNQYVYLRSGQTVLTYDFENTRANTITLADTVSGDVTWMNGSHLAFQSDNLTNHLLDFDGNYNNEIVTSDAGVRLFYSQDLESAYRIISNTQATVLERVPLVAE